MLGNDFIKLVVICGKNCYNTLKGEEWRYRVLMISRSIANLFTGYNWMIIPAAFFTIVLHEMAHGFVAYLLGDRTAKNAGRLTLNPIKHIDVWGLIAMILFKFGWAKPVPVNPCYFKNRRGGMALTAFAGPASNLLLATAALLILKILSSIPIASEFVFELILGAATFVQIFAILNVGLAIFNLIPIPPLDGSKILNSILPERIYFKIMRYEQYGFIILILLLNIPIFNGLITQIRSFVYEMLCLIVGL